MCPPSAQSAPLQAGKTLDFPELDPARPRAAPRGRPAQPEHALRAATLLQTTLELESLLRLFSRELDAVVPHSGLAYRHERRDLSLTLGRRAKHACRYRLSIEKRDLGQITLMRSRPLRDVELEAFEQHLANLVYPLRNALRYREALEAALTDPLTGVYNRSFLDSALRRETGLARRHGTPLSLIMVDVDGLKEANDRYGHRVGDAVIQAVADAVAGCRRRKTDILARYGGDEFVLLLSNTDARGARVLARHIAREVNDLMITVEGRSVKVTVSLGVASLRRHDTRDDLLARADRALYAAKRRRRREGRNPPGRRRRRKNKPV